MECLCLRAEGVREWSAWKIRLGCKRGVIPGEWRILYNEELYDLYSPPNIIRVMKINKNEFDGTCGTYGRGADRVLAWRIWEDLGIDGKTLKFIKKWDGTHGLD